MVIFYILYIIQDLSSTWKEQNLKENLQQKNSVCYKGFATTSNPELLAIEYSTYFITDFQTCILHSKTSSYTGIGNVGLLCPQKPKEETSRKYVIIKNPTKQEQPPPPPEMVEKKKMRSTKNEINWVFFLFQLKTLNLTNVI